MKIKRLVWTIVAALLFWVAQGRAAGTVVQQYAAVGQEMLVVSLSWTGSASDGTVPSTALNAQVMTRVKGMYIYMIETDPGATAPTASYDIVINDANGRDVLGGAGADRSATATEAAGATLSSAIVPVPIDTALTFVLSNNSVHSAVGVVKLYFIKRP
jgi:hypothetical protein